MNEVEIECPGCGLRYWIDFQLVNGCGSCRACGSVFDIKPAKSKAPKWKDPNRKPGLINRILERATQWLERNSQPSSA